MIVAGTITWVLLLGGGLFPLATTAHVCDSRKFGEFVCDPETDGAKFFLCGGPGGKHYLQDCPPGLRFSNTIRLCDLPTSSASCVAYDSGTGRTDHSSLPATKDDALAVVPQTRRKRAMENSVCLGVASDTFWCDPQTNGETFIRCLSGRPYRYKCQPGLFFNRDRDYCDWSWNIANKCVAGEISVTTSSSATSAPSGARTTATKTTTTTTTAATTTAPYPKDSCNSSNCQLPDCRCIGTDIPGNLALSDVPQMILLTFDDGVNVNNFHYYDGLFPEDEQQALKNPNHCRTAATFFVSSDYTDMAMVKKLWDRHNEVASHSLTHGHPSTWDAPKWQQEMQGMREALATAVGANVSQITGMRSPYLELGGETQFAMMQNNHITYDSSMFGGSLDGSNTDHPVWPFSLHYSPTRAVCDQGNCPTGSYPEVWEVPIIRQYNLQGQACSMTDTCTFPAGASAENVTAFLRHNFQRHYSTNRAPFMISLHATWFHNVPASLDGLKAFLNETNADTDVWQVTVTQMLDWVRHPLPLDRVTELDSWKRCV